eukprot:COSAG01_NODE_3802_length_5684_cov_2.050313_4_plen_123_part_00
MMISTSSVLSRAKESYQLDEFLRWRCTPRLWPQHCSLCQHTSELTTLSACYADDTWNVIKAASVDALLDNGTLWCMASSGGNEPTKQALGCGIHHISRATVQIRAQVVNVYDLAPLVARITQ